MLLDSENRPKRATLNDVAQAAGVSYQTVSRVINDSPQVSPKTRHQVLHAIELLGFQPNRAAQALAKRRTFTLEVISFGLDYFGPAQMLSSVEHAAKAQGYKTMFATIAQMSPTELQTLTDGLAGLVDGVIVIAPITAAAVLPTTTTWRGVPILQIGNRLGDTIPSAVIDQFQGSRLATQHLIDLGHRHIAEITGPLEWYDALERHQGWRIALETSRLDATLYVSGDWTAAGGYRMAQHLLAAGRPFTGLVVANDQMALGAIQALSHAGLPVPDQVSVVGFDDIPEAAYFVPPLTTVHQDFAALGAQSVEYLIQLIEAPGTTPYQRVLHPTLVLRQSTAAPR